MLVPLALVVVAAFLHASWNLFAKRAADAGAVLVWAYCLVAAITYAPVVLWFGLHGMLVWTVPVAACIGASALIHIGYSLSLQRGYQVADLSVVYPVARGTGPLLSSACAFLLLGERPSGGGLCGLFAVVIGILLIATQGSLASFRRPGGQAGLRWGLTIGALIASYTVIDGYGVKELAVVPVALDWISNLVRLVLLSPFLARNLPEGRTRMRGHWGAAIAVGILSPLAYILVLQAMRMGAPLSVVAPAREMSMMVGALFGLVFLGEPVGRVRLFGCALLVGGVVLLGLS